MNRTQSSVQTSQPCPGTKSHCRAGMTLPSRDSARPVPALPLTKHAEERNAHQQGSCGLHTCVKPGTDGWNSARCVVGPPTGVSTGGRRGGGQHRYPNSQPADCTLLFGTACSRLSFRPIDRQITPHVKTGPFAPEPEAAACKNLLAGVTILSHTYMSAHRGAERPTAAQRCRVVLDNGAPTWGRVTAGQTKLTSA